VTLFTELTQGYLPRWAAPGATSWYSVIAICYDYASRLPFLHALAHHQVLALFVMKTSRPSLKRKSASALVRDGVDKRKANDRVYDFRTSGDRTFVNTKISHIPTLGMPSPSFEHGSTFEFSAPLDFSNNDGTAHVTTKVGHIHVSTSSHGQDSGYVSLGFSTSTYYS
jgi:hypothetical protein